MNKEKSRLARMLSRFAYVAGYPFYGYMDARFRDLHERIARRDQDVRDLRDSLQRLQDRLLTEAKVISEAGIYAERKSVEILDRIAGIDADPPAAASLSELTAAQARFLNMALSDKGFSAQASLWFNPCIVLYHRRGGVRLLAIHDRIIELPFAFAAASRLKPGSAVLDVGSSESILSITLATQGHHVMALDQRPGGIPHPRLTPVTADIGTWTAPVPLDAIFCISTMEHFGIRAYGSVTEDEGLDRKALGKFREWLKPGGLLVLTVPVGPAAEPGLERRYELADIFDLLKDWTINESVLYARVEPTRWERQDIPPPPDFWDASKRCCLMIQATPATKR